jgi:hypothetical protein
MKKNNEKSIRPNFFQRNSGLILKYWMLVLVPLALVNSNILNNMMATWTLLFYFVIFVAPFLFIIYFRRAKLNNFSEIIIFVSLGLIIPYICVFMYVYIFLKNLSLGGRVL